MEVKYTLPKPFSHDNVSCDHSDPKFEYKDQIESDLNIENEFLENPNPVLVPTPNPRPK